MKNNSPCLPMVRRSLATATAALVGLSHLSADEPAVTVKIQCSPATVMLESVASGNWMTVHTDLSFHEVMPTTVGLSVDTGDLVTLNDLPNLYLYSDNRGFLVVKFDLAEIKGMIDPPIAELELTLRGTRLDGASFVGASFVKVMDKPSVRPPPSVRPSKPRNATERPGRVR